MIIGITSIQINDHVGNNDNDDDDDDDCRGALHAPDQVMIWCKSLSLGMCLLQDLFQSGDDDDDDVVDHDDDYDCLDDDYDDGEDGDDDDDCAELEKCV